MAKILAVCVMAVLACVPVANAVQCYACTGVSGDPDTSLGTTFCGIPFRDDGNLGSVTCNGLCYTSTFFGLSSTGAVGSTVARGCTDVPAHEGCWHVDSAIGKGSFCTETCESDLCNNESDASALIPSRLTVLLAASILAVVSKPLRR